MALQTEHIDRSQFFATKLAASSFKKNAHAKEATAYLLTYWDIAVWLQSSQLL